MMTYMKIGWRPLQVHNISDIYNIIYNNNNRHKKVYMLLDCNEENGDTTFFCNIQTIRNTCTM
jgi:hypothetical protein